MLPYFSRRALRPGRGILEPSMAMVCRPHTPVKHAWESRESLLHRKSSIRSKHSLKMEWLMPERALLKACWEHFTVSGRGAPDERQSSWKNSSREAEMVFLTFDISCCPCYWMEYLSAKRTENLFLDSRL